MTIQFHLDYEEERITNLNVANAIIEACAGAPRYALDPTTIAKAILLDVESEEKIVRERQAETYVRSRLCLGG